MFSLSLGRGPGRGWGDGFSPRSLGRGPGRGSMELILWRHAEAEDANGEEDIARELTKKGRKQAERMAQGLRPKLDDGWRILVSPAKRALQTVKPLDLPFEESEAVGPSTVPADVLREAGW